MLIAPRIGGASAVILGPQTAIAGSISTSISGQDGSPRASQSKWV